MEMKFKALANLVPILFLMTMTFDAILVVAGPDVIRVPEDYPLIQWAINAANPGDTILVSPGVYNERIIVNKSVNLVGQNRDTTVIDAQETGTVITVTAPKVNITGLTIQNGKTGDLLNPGRGIVGGYTISNNRIRNNDCGILDAAIIKNNIVQNNGGYVEGHGIHSHNSLIEENVVSNNRIGIEGHGSTIKNNLMENQNGYGLKVGSSLVVGNTIRENYEGIYVSTMGYWGNTIYHNNFIDNEEQVVNYEYYQESSWDNGAEGNYWSDYKGVDADGNGIGDTLVPHIGVDNYPLMRPWDEIPPVARISNPLMNSTWTEDETIYINGGSSSDLFGIVSYEWDFGDGTNGTGESVEHKYSNPGTYNISLTVKDIGGNTDSAWVVIVVLRDTDGDGISDSVDSDDDNDGVLDDDDAFPLDASEWLDTDGDDVGNNADTDDDNDGMPDIWENKYRLNPLDPSDASLDPDNDGLTNFEEYQQGTDPNVSNISMGWERYLWWIVGIAVVMGLSLTAIIFWRCVKKGVRPAAPTVLFSFS